MSKCLWLLVPLHQSITMEFFQMWNIFRGHILSMLLALQQFLPGLFSMETFFSHYASSIYKKQEQSIWTSSFMSLHCTAVAFSAQATCCHQSWVQSVRKTDQICVTLREYPPQFIIYVISTWGDGCKHANMSQPCTCHIIAMNLFWVHVWYSGSFQSNITFHTSSLAIFKKVYHIQ